MRSRFMDEATRSFLKANEFRRRFLVNALHEALVVKWFERFRAANIEPILIKGWSIARFYPIEKMRAATDIDLAIHPQDYRKAVGLLKNFERESFEIDLHKGFRQLDLLPFENLFDNSQTIEIARAKIRVLRDEDNLRLAAVHWLIDGGAKPERLWDIYYLVQNRSTNFDWDRCLNQNGALRRRWIVCAIAAAHRYLNLNVADTPLAVEAADEKVFPKWFLPALEKEWNDPVKLDGAGLRLRKFRLSREQLRKRLQPNPILASILLEAPFDDSPRLPYQIANVFQRIWMAFSSGRILKKVENDR